MIYFFILAVSYIVVFLITPNIRYVGLRFSAIDKREQRKIHKKVITKLGGLGIFLGFIAGLGVIAIFDKDFFKMNYFGIASLLACLGLMLTLGMYDDFQGSNAFTKLFIEIIVALLLLKIGFRLERIFFPGLIDFPLGRFSAVITVFWLVGIINAINLIDGLDGLAAGVAAIVSFFICIYGILLGEKLIIFISLALVGANLAFLRYNFHPAKIFMGDTGSLFLGCTLGALAIYQPKTLNISNPLFLPVAFTLLLPIMDTFFAVIRRLLRKQPIFIGDSCHLHHYYIKLGFSQIHTVVSFYAMTFSLGLGSLAIIYAYQHF